MDITITQNGGSYILYFLADTDLGTGNLYALEVRDPYADSNSCWAPTILWKRVNGVETVLYSFTQYCRHNGRNQMTLRGVFRQGQQMIWASPTVAYTFYDSQLSVGRPGVGLSNTPAGNSIAKAYLGDVEFVAPPAPLQSSFGASTLPDAFATQVWPTSLL